MTTEAEMDRKRPIPGRPRASAEDPATCAAAGSPQPTPRPGSVSSRSGDPVSRETWRRLLAAHVLPLPGTAD
jgi:hypothetical protein